MYAPENTETSDLMGCHACGAQQRDRDRFCRRCGVSQRPNIASVTGGRDWFACETRPLPGTQHYDSFSGVLVNLVAEGVFAQASALSSSLVGNRWTMRLVSALVAVPFWFMIVLLSPLDAYVAVRAIARRV